MITSALPDHCPPFREIEARTKLETKAQLLQDHSLLVYSLSHAQMALLSCLGMVLPTVGWSLLHQSSLNGYPLMKEILQLYLFNLPQSICKRITLSQELQEISCFHFIHYLIFIRSFLSVISILILKTLLLLASQTHFLLVQIDIPCCHLGLDFQDNQSIPFVKIFPQLVQGCWPLGFHSSLCVWILVLLHSSG